MGGGVLLAGRLESVLAPGSVMPFFIGYRNFYREELATNIHSKSRTQGLAPSLWKPLLSFVQLLR